MSLGEIFNNSIRYPFNDPVKILIVGVVFVLVSLTGIVSSFSENSVVFIVAWLISLIFSAILGGYQISVIREGIADSDVIPEFDFAKNFIDGIKSYIISIVYLIIPLIILSVVGLVTGVIGSSLDHIGSAIILIGILALLLALFFGIFEIIAVARFANSDDWTDAFRLGAVIDEAKDIGFLKILGFLIIFFIILVIVTIIMTVFGIIPYVGIIIADILCGGYLTLMGGKSVGLLYADR